MPGFRRSIRTFRRGHLFPALILAVSLAAVCSDRADARTPPGFDAFIGGFSAEQRVRARALWEETLPREPEVARAPAEAGGGS